MTAFDPRAHFAEHRMFAAGDVVRGASLLVWAIRDGRDAAASMHRWLKAKAVGAKVAA